MTMARKHDVSGGEPEMRHLDALVLAEIESLDHARDGRPFKGAASGQEAGGADRPVPAEPVARIHGNGREARGLSGEEAEGLFHGEDDIPEEPDETRDTGLYSAEEEAFITRAVGFLSGRDNADMILGRIWEQVTEADPGGYFDPAEPEAPSAFEGGIAGTPAEGNVAPTER